MSGSASIETERLRITTPEPSAAARVCAFYGANRAHLEPWEPARPPGFYTEAFWQRRLAANRDELANGVSLRLFVELRGDASIIGTCNFSNLISGAFRAGYVGYALAEDRQDQGYMAEALEATLPYAIERLGLHRVMANYQPSNERSGRLLSRLGFEIEGYARDYLFIDGAWRDHILTALVGEP